MIEISLLPVDEELAARPVQKGLGFEVPRFIPRGFGIAVIVLMAMYLLAHMRASSLSATLASSKETLSSLKNLAGQAQAIETELPNLRERAKIFQTRLQNRKVWSRLLQEIVLCCPDEIQLAEIKLSVPRTGAQPSKELLVSGFYLTGGNVQNLEMDFKETLQKNKTIGVYYKSFVVMTNPQVGKTDFSIRCTE